MRIRLAVAVMAATSMIASPAAGLGDSLVVPPPPTIDPAGVVEEVPPPTVSCPVVPVGEWSYQIAGACSEVAALPPTSLFGATLACTDVVCTLVAAIGPIVDGVLDAGGQLPDLAVEIVDGLTGDTVPAVIDLVEKIPVPGADDLPETGPVVDEVLDTIPDGGDIPNLGGVVDTITGLIPEMEDPADIVDNILDDVPDLPGMEEPADIVGNILDQVPPHDDPRPPGEIIDELVDNLPPRPDPADLVDEVEQIIEDLPPTSDPIEIIEDLPPLPDPDDIHADDEIRDAVQEVTDNPPPLPDADEVIDEVVDQIPPLPDTGQLIDEVTDRIPPAPDVGEIVDQIPPLPDLDELPDQIPAVPEDETPQTVPAVAGCASPVPTPLPPDCDDVSGATFGEPQGLFGTPLPDRNAPDTETPLNPLTPVPRTAAAITDGGSIDTALGSELFQPAIDRQAFVDYVNRWTIDGASFLPPTDPNYKYHDPDAYRFPTDCTNLVSWALLHAGWEEKGHAGLSQGDWNDYDKWFFESGHMFRYSHTWAVSNKFFGMMTVTGWGVSVRKWSSVRVGDILQFDWGSSLPAVEGNTQSDPGGPGPNGWIDHTAVVTSFQNGVPHLTYHSYDHEEKSIDDVLATRPGTLTYAWRVG